MAHTVGEGCYKLKSLGVESSIAVTNLSHHDSEIGIS